MVESLHQPTHQHSSDNFQQMISETKINVFTLKAPPSMHTSNTISPAIFNTNTSSIENLRPQENNSLSQSATASRANVGCGKAVSVSREVSQGAFIIPTQNSITIGSSVSSRIPLATLQQNSRSQNMPQNKLVSTNNRKSGSTLEESFMEQDENVSVQNVQVFQLYSSPSRNSNELVGTTLSGQSPNQTQFNPPAPKRMKLRESWFR